jgi:superfamily I DNA/RNA helicase
MELLTDPLFVLPYDHVLIDEGQDFRDEWIDALESLRQGDFYVFFDRNQLVQQSRMPSWVDRSECRLTLTRNCRNTLQIARISHRAVLGRVTAEDLMPAGPRPVLHACADEQSMLDLAVQRATAWIADGRYAPHEVAVLTMRSTTAKSFVSLSKIGGHPVSEEITMGSVSRNTVRRFKGLEAKAVLLLDVDVARFGDPTERNLFYVGCSRAMHELEVLFTNVTQQSLSSAIDAMAPGRKIPKTPAGFCRFFNGRWGTEAQE